MKMRIGFLHFLFSFSFLLSSTHNISQAARDTITSTQSLRDGETIISSGGNFEMGFLSSPAGSLNRYISIWYKQIPVPTVIWIANTQTALTNTTSAVFKIVKPGRLVLTDAKHGTIWSSTNNTTSRSAKNPIAQLLDSGNLVVRDADDENPENFLWQSFDYPTDTYFPGMKLGWNFLTGHEVFLTARKNENSPASGQFTAHLDPTGYPQIVIKNGTEEVYATGPWNGLRWSGTPTINPDDPHFKYKMHMNPREVYTRYDIVNNSICLRLVLSSSGEFESLGWVNETQSWFSFIKSPMDICDKYKFCGANGICNLAKSPLCGCLENFVHNSTGGGGADGCHRRKPLKCKNGSDGFKKYSGIKLPDTKHSWFNATMSLKECEHKCLKNCSCTAYSSLDISKGGSGCLLWFNDLFGIRVLSRNGQDIYIRLDSSEIPEPIAKGPHPSSKGKKVNKIIFGSLLLLIIIILLSLSLGFYFYKKSKKGRKLKEWLDIPLFNLSTLLRATNNFSDNNKLGKGGFGAVYKGVLRNKQEIAVKRLSKSSTQGVEEFKNEVICIAKLQHRNLVKLLGCCIQGEEKLLVYEYMANKSLDTFIFDETKSKLLDWPKRFSIIIGIARGLLYLHQDSRLRIIHRDLKANNVLLDNMMNPKISDFGLARSVLGDATEANTNRIVGTHGYISPEYAGDGIFSVKSDTFSFGVLLLEIVTSKRNRGFCHPNHSLNLISHAWKLYKENRELELIDEHLAPSCDLSQAQRSIQIALLCVQQYPEDRPIMSSVVAMLSNDSTLPEAKEPGFFTERRVSESNYSSSTQGESSRNVCSISLLDPR